MVGDNYYILSISNSYASGGVTGGYVVGGLVGYNTWYSTVDNSYATGTVMGSGYMIGGLVGANYLHLLSLTLTHMEM